MRPSSLDLVPNFKQLKGVLYGRSFAEAGHQAGGSASQACREAPSTKVSVASTRRLLRRAVVEELREAESEHQANLSTPRRLVSKRTTALFLLILQNASVSLLTRLSRTPGAGTAIYAPSVAVFVAELMKLMASLTMLARERQAAGKEKEGRTSLVGHARRAVVDLLTNQRGEIIKLAVPAALYAVQNTLLVSLRLPHRCCLRELMFVDRQYVALSHLSASVYQTTYQLKLLTAALFSVIIFKRALSRTQWASLLLLTLGVATVQLDGVRHPPPSDSSGQDQRIGLLAILAACISSGLAGGWFEHVLKSPSARAPPTPSTSPIKPSFQPPTPSSPLRLRHNSPSLWARNLQLSVPSLAFSLAGVFLSPEWSRVRKHGPLQGFTPLVWSVVLNQALGGLLVAMVVRESFFRVRR